MYLVQMRRDIADREAHAPVIALVGAGAVDDAYMVEREFAGLEQDINRLIFVDIRFDLLATGQQAFLGVGFTMRNLPAEMAAGKHPHGA
mgnify:CR=1 FL=1